MSGMRVFDLASRPTLRQPPPVTVNGTVIDQAAIAREAQHHPAGSAREAGEAAARALVIRHLLLEEAGRLAIEGVPEVDDEGRRETPEEARISTLLRQEVQVPEADREAARRFYLQNRARFTSPDLYEAAHILFRPMPRTRWPTGRPASRRRLPSPSSPRGRSGSLHSPARRRPAPSAASGGNLGQVTGDAVTPAFAEALRRAEPGRVHPEPVETPYGVHVLRLERRSRAKCCRSRWSRSGSGSGWVPGSGGLPCASTCRSSSAGPRSAASSSMAPARRSCSSEGRDAGRADRKPDRAGVAEAALIEAGELALLARLNDAAGRLDTDPAGLASYIVRTWLTRADDEAWLRLIGVMNRSEMPGLAALALMLGQALAELDTLAAH
ncbi:MAG: peptidylprolyl isomerase [Geminicoccaceae bacterium]